MNDILPVISRPRTTTNCRAHRHCRSCGATHTKGTPPRIGHLGARRACASWARGPSRNQLGGIAPSKGRPRTQALGAAVDHHDQAVRVDAEHAAGNSGRSARANAGLRLQQIGVLALLLQQVGQARIQSRPDRRWLIHLLRQSAGSSSAMPFWRNASARARAAARHPTAWSELVESHLR